MDTLRGHFAGGAEPTDDRYYDAGDDSSERETPPSPVGQDERRMQVRAYNHWAGLLDDRNFPAIEDLDPQNLPDFGPYSVLLDFSTGIEDPGVTFIGDKLAAECDARDSQIGKLSDVPSRSLLSRITDHYMQILANQAPIGFEAEFVNQRGSTILYRGILLPFSSDDDTIDFIYGVINWKELADQKTTDELMLEIDQALEDEPANATDLPEFPAVPEELEAPGLPEAAEAEGDPKAPELPEAAEAQDETLAQWAERTATQADEAEAGQDEAYEDDTAAYEDDDSVLDLSRLISSGLARTNDDEDEDELPRPRFGWREEPLVDGDAAAADESQDETEAPAPAPDGYSPLVSKGQLPQSANPFDVEVADEEDGYDEDEAYGEEAFDEASFDEEPVDVDSEAADAAQPVAEDSYSDSAAYQDEAPVEEPQASEPAAPVEAPVVPAAYEPAAAEEPVAEAPEFEPATTIDIPDISDDEMGLGDWLASARELAAAAKASEDRTRQALYEAVGRAYDFSLAALAEPEEFADIVADAGLTMQDRAPMTPVVKLVFGADYDKTRLTEYATALSHGHRLGVARGELAGFIDTHEGGLKGVVQAERRLRREEAGKPVEAKNGPREGLARKLRGLAPRDFAEIAGEGPEFALVMIRRNPLGEVEMIGEVPEDVPLVERAARKMLG